MGNRWITCGIFFLLCSVQAILAADPYGITMSGWSVGVTCNGSWYQDGSTVNGHAQYTNSANTDLNLYWGTSPQAGWSLVHFDVALYAEDTTGNTDPCSASCTYQYWNGSSFGATQPDLTAIDPPAGESWPTNSSCPWTTNAVVVMTNSITVITQQLVIVISSLDELADLGSQLVGFGNWVSNNFYGVPAQLSNWYEDWQDYELERSLWQVEMVEGLGYLLDWGNPDTGEGISVKVKGTVMVDMEQGGSFDPPDFTTPSYDWSGRDQTYYATNTGWHVPGMEGLSTSSVIDAESELGKESGTNVPAGELEQDGVWLFEIPLPVPGVDGLGAFSMSWSNSLLGIDWTDDEKWQGWDDFWKNFRTVMKGFIWIYAAWAAFRLVR